MRKSKPILDAELLRSRLKLKNIAAEKKLLTSHASAAKFFSEKGLHPGKIREHATKLLTSGILTGTLLLASPQAITPPATQPTLHATAAASSFQAESLLKNALADILPKDIRTLNTNEEQKVTAAIKQAWGITAGASLEGNKLNDDYGRMGAEQHLARFPGDNVENMAPGLGGWGYFAYSQDQMTPELTALEKWYVAIQTLYLPDWKTNTAYLVKWYKYRKVVVVNPANGKTIIADIADAGPADWTGKKFGGSPEVMQYLGINYGRQNHPVVLFFLDDPKNQIPVGPIEYNITTYGQNIL